jgi:hypothetical protein
MFNAQGSRVMIIAMEVLRKKRGKMKNRMKLSLPPKLLENLVWIPVI